MTNIKQVREDLTPEQMRDLAINWRGYPIHQVNTWTERKLRITIEEDHDDGLLSDRDIREVVDV